MKDIVGKLETSKKTYPICFNLNVLEEIQTKWGSMTKWGEIVETFVDKEPRIKEMKEGLLFMINEGIDLENEDKQEKEPFVTLKQVGRIITEVGLNEVSNIIMSLVKNSTEIDDTKNE